ncbi:MAG: hypothetical protein GEU90_05790 [Gemmatimonas sp.]|nr:hypothetical protein [Gemmatimonas sp.]
MSLNLSEDERRVLGLAPGEGVALSSFSLHRLLASPDYHPSLGDPGHARHFRRALPDGTGLHLVIVDGRAELHRDLFDPHRGPVAMLLHVATDSPTQVMSLFAAGWSVLHRLGR